MRIFNLRTLKIKTFFVINKKERKSSKYFLKKILKNFKKPIDKVV